MISPQSRTLLLGWEGADWKILRPMGEKGFLPALSALVDRGTAGELHSTPPYVSAMLWAGLVTGERAGKHGICGAREVDGQGRTQPISSGSRCVPALWDFFSAAGRQTHLIGGAGFAPFPAGVVNGLYVSEPFFDRDSPSLPAGSVQPAALAAELEGLRVGIRDLDPGILKLLVPGLTQAEADRDPRILRLAKLVAELYSVHNVAVSWLETEPWDFAAVHFRFFGEIVREFGVFLPPRRANVSRGAFERFSGVVEGACRLLDLLLADLLRVVGKETRLFLVSERGCFPGNPAGNPHSVEGILGLERPTGIFVAAGPGIRKGNLFVGPRLLDVAPTILHAAGLAPGAGMAGRVVHEIFEPHALASKAPSPAGWDERACLLPLRPGVAPSGLEKVSGKGEPVAAEAVRFQNRWHLGMELLHAGLAEEALPYLEEASWALPESAPHLFWLAHCQARLGLAEEARRTAKALDDFGETVPALHRLQGWVALELGEEDRALKHFDRAMAQAAILHDVPTLTAWALQRKGRWLEALELLQAEAPRYATAMTWHCIAHGALKAKRPRMAVDAARQLVRSAPDQFQSHRLLAEALALAGERAAAWNALKEAQRLGPGCAEVIATGRRLFPDRAALLREWAQNAEPEPLPPASGVEALRMEANRRREAFMSRRSKGADGEIASEILKTGSLPGIAARYRPPSSCEMERFAAVLGSGSGEAAPGSGRRHCRVWEISPPSRFAGAALWSKFEMQEGIAVAEIRFRLRPNFQAPETAAALLRPLFEEIRQAGCRAARVILPERANWEAILARFGLHWTAQDEYWKTDAIFSHDKILQTAKQWKKRLPPGWRARPLEATDWEFVKEASGSARFFSGAHLEEIRRTLDDDISSLVEAPSGPAGVLLATRSGMTAVIEFLGAVDPALAPFVSQMALARLLRRDRPDLFDEVIFTNNPGKGDAVRRMMRRFDASLLYTYHHFFGELH
ncbi:MAG TPA: alkaline phosphatase family protein [Chthoniobacteraceae bacterium]|nr:alkaline phosphatase family protein [Chthoniobacteraceae bacterium]